MSKKSRARKQKHLAREQAQKQDQKPPPPTDQHQEIRFPLTLVRECPVPDDGLKHPLRHFEPVPLEEVFEQVPSAPLPPAPTEPSPIIKLVDDPNVPGIYHKRSTFCEPPEEKKGSIFSNLVKDTPTVDAGKLLKQCLTNMSNAMTPRTADGELLNNMSIGDVRQARIPVVEQPANPTRDNPIRALYHAHEFENGNTPDGLHYVDGYVECREGPDGKPIYITTFADPVRGLSDQDRAALELGRRMQQSGSAAHQPFPKQEDPPAEDSLLPDHNTLDMVIDRPQEGCLIYSSKKGAIKLTNFRLVTLESRLIIGKQNDGTPTVEYLVQIICGSISRNITLTPQELDNTVRKIQNELPSCIVLPGVMKANQYITNYLRQQLINAPQKVYVERTGFLRLAGVWFYVHDRAVPPDPNTVFNTGRYIPDRPGASDAQAFHDALMFLDISHKDELILILFLLAHLGPLFQLFHESGRTPRFVTILVGRSGSLKTSLSLILYRLFADQGRTPTATFKDTETALELKLAALAGTTGIFDDFRPPVSDLKSKVNAEKLESIIRAVGDHVSKSRSNVKLERAREFIPSGSVLITAEDLSGSHSSYLRSLIVSIGKGDINGSRLRFFQNNPDIIPAHMNRFLRWIGQHGDEVIDRIRCEYPAALFENTVTELRLVDTAATLMMTAQLLGSYAEACGAMTAEQKQSFLTRCYTAISTAVVASEAMSKDANPCVMHLEALFSLMDRGEIRLAENMKMYPHRPYLSHPQEFPRRFSLCKHLRIT